MLVTGSKCPTRNAELLVYFLIHTITLIPDLKEKYFQVFLFTRNAKRRTLNAIHPSSINRQP
jgi:hypothetical protein